MRKRKLQPKAAHRRIPAWDRATLEELESYKGALEVKLLALQCPHSMLHCQNPLCDRKDHSEARDKVVLDVLLSMVECSYSSLPLTGKVGGRAGPRDIIPGWSKEVGPHRKVAYTCVPGVHF